MRAAFVAIAMLTLGATFVFAQDVNVTEIGKSPTEAKFVSGGKVRMDLCPSGMEVVGKDSNVLRVEYDSNRGNDVRVRIQVSGDRVAAAEVLSAIVRAERVRRTRIEEQIRPILDTFF